MTPRNDLDPDIPGTAAELDDDDEEAMVAEQLRSTAATARLPVLWGYQPPIEMAGWLVVWHITFSLSMYWEESSELTIPCVRGGETINQLG